jgi:hypothetical protein
MQVFHADSAAKNEKPSSFYEFLPATCKLGENLPREIKACKQG